jgi:flagellar motor component MotA
MNSKSIIGLLVNILATLVLFGYILTEDSIFLSVGSILLVLSAFIISIYYDGPTIQGEINKN